MLQIYNSLTQQKETFKPIKPGEISMYVCGMTVYDYCHIGHGRMLIVFDMVSRYFRSQGFKVKYVRNITDIDDKIIKRANENKEEYSALTERFIQAMHEDEHVLNNLPPDVEPRATEYIPQMIQMIQVLLDKGYAYIAANGDVYYKVNHFKDYGLLAHQDIEKLRAGERVDIVNEKQDPLDFVLWKMAKPNEPNWNSPWGKGRPGWHIECSTMSLQLLDKHFDIHGGGIDLRFPHHQNEIAQSEAATGKKYVNVWVHNGHVQVNREKMSKSLGNFFTIRQVLQQYPAEVIRYFMLASHYRSPINYSADNLESARAALERFYVALRDLPATQKINLGDFGQRFNDAMDDDFNTPVALSVLFDMAREINRLKEEKKLNHAVELAAGLKKLGNDVLGILQQDPMQFLQTGISEVDAKEVDDLIAARIAARKNKNWAEADRIRQELQNQGIVLEDTAEGTIWRRS